MQAAFTICLVQAAPANYLLFSLAHFWLPTVHDVLHADWHEAWHLPHPPFLAVALKSALLIVLICFITNPPFIIYTNIKIISYLNYNLFPKNYQHILILLVHNNIKISNNLS